MRPLFNNGSKNKKPRKRWGVVTENVTKRETCVGRGVLFLGNVAGERKRNKREDVVRKRNRKEKKTQENTRLKEDTDERTPQKLKYFFNIRKKYFSKTILFLKLLSPFGCFERKERKREKNVGYILWIVLCHVCHHVDY
jgi:hypothetical protein